jgi:hypothetical protein
MVAEICRRLDSIPLTLAFAAARVADLGLRSTVEQLDDRFARFGGIRDQRSQVSTVLVQNSAHHAPKTIELIDVGGIGEHRTGQATLLPAVHLMGAPPGSLATVKVLATQYVVILTAFSVALADYWDVAFRRLFNLIGDENVTQARRVPP